MKVDSLTGNCSTSKLHLKAKATAPVFPFKVILMQTLLTTKQLKNTQFP